MSERAVTVQPTGVTPLGDTMPAGTSLQNLDPAHAVWVSTNPGVVPGIGTRLGPLGSLAWQGGPCYATVDTGVTTSVSLTASEHAVNPVNPVDVATATATQLNSKGIPNVLLGKLVYNGPLPLGVSVGGGYSFNLNIDFSQYASITMFIYPNNPCQIKLQWYEPNNGLTFSNPSFQYSGWSMSYGRGIWITQTVKAPFMNLWLGSVSSGSIEVYATNRTLPEGMAGWDTGIVTNIPSTSFGVSQQQAFPDMFMSRGGLYTLRVSSSFAPATCKGFFGYMAYDNSGNSQTLFVAHTGQAVTGPNNETEIMQNVCLPPGLLQLVWQNSITAATYDLKATLTIGEP